jgi:NAD(P)-dependent dehydrogenase (short-subunit alcohol dehydrogenase family)
VVRSRTRRTRKGRRLVSRVEALDELAATLSSHMHVLPCHLADRDEVEKLVPCAEEAMGPLDILLRLSLSISPRVSGSHAPRCAE